MAHSIVELIYFASQVTLSVISIFTLGLVGYQIKQTRNSHDIHILQSFLKDVKEYEDSLLKAAVKEKDNALIDLMNCLEIYALALREKIIPSTSSKLIREKLRDTISIISNNPEFCHKIDEAITGPETFEEIKKFISKHKSEIEILSAKLK